MAAKKLPPKKNNNRRKKSSKSAAKPELQTQAFPDASAFERWLQVHQQSSPGIWLQLMKKASGRSGVSYQAALEIALCWGWIDGQSKAKDAESWLRKFVPRGRRSIWSKINRDKALALIDAGRMQPPGLAEVERAKRDGRWQAAYDSARSAEIPSDLAAALAKSATAAAFFKTLNAANRYAVLFRVQTPKKAETRARKISELVAMLERGETLHPGPRARRSD
jgi:uncharacterized protein YdeI (YjbR/CyaY-like superfamily)